MESLTSGDNTEFTLAQSCRNRTMDNYVANKKIIFRSTSRHAQKCIRNAFIYFHTKFDAVNACKFGVSAHDSCGIFVNSNKSCRGCTTCDARVLAVRKLIRARGNVCK